MRIPTLLLLLLFHFCLTVFSQNLVLDPGFEEGEFNPIKDEVVNPDYLSTSYKWKEWNSADLIINGDRRHQFLGKIPKQKETVAGIYGAERRPPYLREYIRGKLKMELLEGEIYRASLKMKSSDNWYYCAKSVQLLFANDTGGLLEINGERQLINLETDNFEKGKWNQFSVEFTAKENFKWFYLGLLKPKVKKGRYRLSRDYRDDGPYILVDDIRVEPVDTTYQIEKDVIVSEKLPDEKQVETNKFKLRLDYEVNVYDLSKSQKSQIDSLIQELEGYNYRVEIYGFADTTGYYDKNIQLAANRAKTIREF
ncbi:MAG: OmpA family protein [Salibacter sp.]|uniref:OmpA family protein n=1 Tax=Salibacter sp. TaxID=2010995 RepID=UPI00287069CB|nr:OmpA family protein [Salibacter sp.]MDR9399590.1 OmpA family protein [Salibacter sp.]